MMAFGTSITSMMEDMLWLEQVVDYAIKSYLRHEGYEDSWQNIPLPTLSRDDAYAKFVTEWNLNIYERLAVTLAFAPHIKPQALDIFFAKNQLYDRGFTEFGGVTDKLYPGFRPTGQTFAFIVAASDLNLFPVVMETLGSSGRMVDRQVIIFEQNETYAPFLNNVLQVTEGWIRKMVNGDEHEVLPTSFPAKKITTSLCWKDVVLDTKVFEQIDELRNWLRHGATLMQEWGLNGKVKPGYKCLFYGPPGTGKTLTATLVGAESGLDVYRIDLSLITSKYIGETEKNISSVFDIAEKKNWILFFDEADSLFGKRTETNSSNDRYANQQTGYLLQRVEDYPGVVILASNLKANIDDAFTRRFQSVIHFNMPGAGERLMLWKNAFSATCTLHPMIDIDKVAHDYELAGGSIINVLRTCALSAISRNDTVVNNTELLAAIKKEFRKANRNHVVN